MGFSNASYSSVSDPISSGLTWETVSTYNAGLDLSFFKGRLTATADYYVRDTRNMLTTSLTLPDVYGANTPKANCANLRTKWLGSCYELER
jgi:outer membrane receptor protein involved in Fe transport